MKKEIRLFFTALMFYTRIPVPAGIGHGADDLNKSTRYFPFIGWIVGGISALTYMLASLALPPSVAVLLSMVAGVWITGAFHEDGLADICDGFGGGWTREKILSIMKDSRLGAFGAISLVFVLALKFSLLVSMPATSIPFAIIAGHAISRWAAVTMLYTHTYARDDQDSKAKPVAQKPDKGILIFATLFGLLPLILFQNPLVCLGILPVYGMKMYLGRLYQKWIGGYTGDGLGAVQQTTEVVFYLFLLVLWNYT
ncbi:adenosylcobinamide-GDP ribazoletransferase [Roseivirga sp. BDSF3-8]|uniref:adenosylcobinamide-GDP ribazoletransferase n=1 Tax=Roseivirga sp. BDSF3-8 TaxID=3241598 RepID=UPI0035327C1F